MTLATYLCSVASAASSFIVRRSLRRHCRIAALASVGSIALAAPAGVVTMWIGPDGGSFDAPRNWSDGVPTMADTALFFGGGPINVLVPEGSVADRLIFRSGAFTMAIDVALLGMSTSALTPTIVVADLLDDSATLSIAGGAMAGGHATIGAAIGAVGNMHIASDAALILDSVFGIGTEGSGTVELLGSLVANSAQLGVSMSGNGTLAVGGGETFFGQSLILGSFGQGTLTADAGAFVDANEVILALNPLSVGDATISGVDSQLRTTDRLRVAHAGTATLSIENGAVVDVGTKVTVAMTPEWWFFPFFPASDGRIEVRGEGSLLSIAQRLELTIAGFGALAIGDGGRVTVGEHVHFGRAQQSTLEFTLAAGSANGAPMLDVVGDVVPGPQSPSQQYSIVVEPSATAPPVIGVYTLIAADTIGSEYSLELAPFDGLLASVAIVIVEGREHLTVTVTGNPDLDGDGVVDGADLGILLKNWGPCPDPGQSCPADLNGDGVVDGADLGILLAAWGAGR